MPGDVFEILGVSPTANYHIVKEIYLKLRNQAKILLEGQEQQKRYEELDDAWKKVSTATLLKTYHQAYMDKEKIKYQSPHLPLTQEKQCNEDKKNILFEQFTAGTSSLNRSITRNEQTPPKSKSSTSTELILIAMGAFRGTGNLKQNKIEPDGLKTIYKMLGETIKGIQFIGLKLAFENKEKADQFKELYCQYSTEQPNLTSFQLIRGGYPMKLQECQIPVECDEHVLALQFINSEAYFEAQKTPSKRGGLLLEELAKCVDIEGIPVEYRHEHKNQPISEEQLPAEFSEERIGSRIPF